ncbi:STAS domain-containing protein [Planctomycetota bacterium]|nr:STAS domain-containing protein [Planctomycetota bacterium]
MQNRSLVPVLFTVMKGYTKDQFARDVVAGILVGIIAIPLSIALAIASGLSPEWGLITSAVAGFLVAVFGGSRVQIGGPTAAFVPVIYGVVSEFGIDGLLVTTWMAGGILLVMGLSRMGGMIKYIPYPVVTGFTAGIAILTAVIQIKDFTGMDLDKVPVDFVPLVGVYVKNIWSIDWGTLELGIFSLVVMLVWDKWPSKWMRYLPGALVAIVVATLAVAWLPEELGLMGVATIGSQFSDLEGGVPEFTLPSGVDREMVQSLIGPAITIAILAGIESLLSAVVTDGMIGSRHRSNAELVGQGLGNVGAAMFGGMPATGAIARTATNAKNGARTPIAGLVHSATVLLVVLVFMPYAKMIPLTALAAVLFVVCYNMADWHAFHDIGKGPLSDGMVFLLTFVMTVVFELVVALQVGLVLSVFLFMKRMADVADVQEVGGMFGQKSTGRVGLHDAAIRRKIMRKFGSRLLVYEINGPFFFGVVDKFVDVTRQIRTDVKGILVLMGDVPVMDATALHHFETFIRVCGQRKVKLYLVGAQEQPLLAMKKKGLLDHVGDEHICDEIGEAVEKFEFEMDKKKKKDK